MRKKDIICLIIIVLLLFLGYAALKNFQSIQGSKGRIAIIIQQERVIERIDLDKVSEPREIRLSGSYDETILVEKGRIRFKEADCPDQICVKTGWLEEPGDTAVCLPNRAIVRIETK